MNNITRIRDMEDLTPQQRSLEQQMLAGNADPPMLQHDQSRRVPLQIDPSSSRYLSMNCIDIANHIYYCPICSKFYACDRRLYIITIAVLVIICVMLLKRVIDM